MNIFRKIKGGIEKLLNLIADNLFFSLVGKKGRILAAAVTIGIIIFLIINKDLYLDPALEVKYGTALFVVSLICAPVIGLLIAVKPSVTERFKVLANTVMFFLLPVATIQMVEAFNSNFVYGFSVPTFCLYYLLVLCLYLIFYVITGKFHAVGLIVNIALLVWSLLNYFIAIFRGSPFVPMDVLSFSTGLGVADGYKAELSWQLIMGCMLFVMTWLVNRRIQNVKPKLTKFKLFAKLLPAGYVVVFLLTFFATDAFPNAGYRPDFWNQARGYGNTGSFFNFCLNARYLHVSKPEGYNADDTDDLLYQVLAEAGVTEGSDTSINILTGENDYVASADATMPNLICIMNESLADLRNLGNLATNEETMPFMDSLTENTIKGNLYMPVFGAGTSNSEFEFLTGNTVSALPAGSNAYEAYIKDISSSLVSTVKSMGYSVHAYHPYYKDGWNRPSVYNLMGFETYTAIEDFIDNDILDEYIQTNNAEAYNDQVQAAYPDKEILLRRFVSDSYDYKMVEEMYEEQEGDQPFFVFNITMQNHGGYGVSYTNFAQEIFSTNLEGYYPQANRYLSLVKRSDDAFQELVEYFQNVDEPTIICMFGDHLPSIENDFYEEMLGTDLDNLTTEQEQLRYTTPFIIWANYDIPEATIEKMSSNYLSTLLLQVAGLELTEYNKFLAALYQELPVTNMVGYIDKEGTHYSLGEESEYSDLINIYNCIQYNNMF
ncbi:MAG: LTA synthase family protein, partial [Eubacterium sp.]|nr:LTA synthase family protein [Eubacterium sp.]